MGRKVLVQLLRMQMKMTLKTYRRHDYLYLVIGAEFKS